jgi:4-aminobutyrate aminotransferase-like enzyme
VKQRLAKSAQLARCHPDPSGVGAMWAFTAFDGSAGAVDAVVRAALDEGLLVFSAGAQPSRVRLLLPVDTSDEELAQGFALLERALGRVAARRSAAC